MLCMTSIIGLARAPLRSLRSGARGFARSLILAGLAALCPTTAAWARQYHGWVNNDHGTPIWCGLPQTVSDTPEPPDDLPYPYPVRRNIDFEVPISPGVHEQFDAEVVGVKGWHEFPADTVDHYGDFFDEFPTAHCAVQFDPIIIGNDCDGDGIYMPGPGNPPCFGHPTAQLMPLLEQGAPGFPKDIRASSSCLARPKFRLRISGPPILNGGIVGIRIRGKNLGLFLGAAARSQDNIITSGHAWVKLSRIPTNHFEAWGKYPIPDAQGRNQPFAPGSIRDDRQNGADHTAWFPVTLQECNAAIQVIRANAPPNQCSAFNVLTANCTHFMRDVMAAAGCPIPDPSMFGTNGLIVSPLAFNRRCSLLLQTSSALERCGVLTASFAGGGGGAGFDAGAAYELLRDNPAILAAQLRFAFAEIDAGSCTLRPNTPLTLCLDGEQDVLVAIDYGDSDGETVAGGPGVRTHVYAQPGTYALTVTALVQGEVRRYSVAVTVSKKAPNGAKHTVHIAEAAEQEFPPVDERLTPPAFIRACPGDVDSSFSTDGADLAIVLSEWGSVSVTMADIDENGVVDANDLAFVLSDWGRCDP